MAVLTRQLRDASDEIPDPLNPQQQEIQLRDEEWERLQHYAAAATDQILRQNRTLSILRPALITATFLSLLAFLLALGVYSNNAKLETKLNESIARGKEAVATLNGNVEAFNEHIRQSNFRVGLLESSHSSAAYRDTSGKVAVVPNVPLADKNQQVQWINFDAAKMELEGRKVESVRLEVRSKPIKSKVQNVQSTTSTNHTGQATGSVGQTITPVSETTESKKEKP